MKPPKPRAPAYDDGGGIGRSVVKSPGTWVSVLAVAAILFLAAQMLMNAGQSSGVADAVVDQATTTTIDVYGGWVVGGCAGVDIGGRASPMDCGNHRAVVVAFVALPDDCPDASDWFLRLTSDVACFENAVAGTDS